MASIYADAQNTIDKDVARIKAESALSGTPLQGVHVISDLNNSGFIFLDSFGTQIQFIPEKDLYAKNPYIINGIEPSIDHNSDTYRMYFVESLSPSKIKSILPKRLHYHINDTVFEKVSFVNSTVNNWYIDFQDKKYFVISYTLDLLGEDGVGKWAETTIRIYDKNGAEISEIHDNHNIQIIYITPDGKYLIANKVIEAFGDGMGHIYKGMFVYNINNGARLGDIIRLTDRSNIVTKIPLNYNRPQYFDNFITGYFYEYDIDRPDNVQAYKMAIDPIDRLLYYMALDDSDFSSGRPVIKLKSATYPKGEDLKYFLIKKF
ncbi:MAG: hypothetical protein JNM22_16325 [Saprospiraceae bacterium]|nr:hypothetical protein [Saprospiraceae bacterium]